MTNYVKELTSTVHQLSGLYDKLKDFKDFEDLEELSDLMGTNSNIESVIRWVTSYDKPTESDVIPTTINLENSIPFMDHTTDPPTCLLEPTTPVHKEYYTPNDVAESIKSLVEDNEPTIKVDLSRFIDKVDRILEREVPEVLEKERELQEAQNSSTLYANEKEEEEVEEELDVTDPSNDGFVETAPHMKSYDFPENICKKIMESYQNKDWLKLYKGEWRRNPGFPMMQSRTGLFWDLTRNMQAVPRWMSGDLRVNVNPKGYIEDCKLCGVMMCALWHLKRPYDFSENFVFTVKDGNRRNLEITNLTYESKDVQLMPTVRLIHDICQRAIDCNFNISKILTYYENSSPSVSARWISDIIYKKDTSSISISDVYWNLVNGKPEVITEKSEKQEAGNHVDIVGNFRQLKDPRICAMLFMDKISNGYDLTHQEQELLVNVAKWDLPPEKRFHAEIAEHIEKKFSWKMSKETVKGFLNHRGPITKEYEQVAMVKGGDLL